MLCCSRLFLLYLVRCIELSSRFIDFLLSWNKTNKYRLYFCNMFCVFFLFVLIKFFSCLALHKTNKHSMALMAVNIWAWPYHNRDWGFSIHLWLGKFPWIRNGNMSYLGTSLQSLLSFRTGMIGYVMLCYAFKNIIFNGKYHNFRYFPK